MKFSLPKIWKYISTTYVIHRLIDCNKIHKKERYKENLKVKMFFIRLKDQFSTLKFLAAGRSLRQL